MPPLILTNVKLVTHQRCSKRELALAPAWPFGQELGARVQPFYSLPFTSSPSQLTILGANISKYRASVTEETTQPSPTYKVSMQLDGWILKAVAGKCAATDFAV